MQQPKFSLVISCYNNADQMPLMMERLIPMYQQCPAFEIILVDNGSEDETQHVIRQLFAQYRNFAMQAVHIPVNKGYGYGVLEGLKRAKGAVLAWVDASVPTISKDVMRAYYLYQASERDVLVKGKRLNRKPLDRMFTLSLEFIASMTLMTPLSDIDVHPKLFSKEFYNQFVENAPGDDAIHLYVLYQAKQCQLPVISIDVSQRKRPKYETQMANKNLLSHHSLIYQPLSCIFSLKKHLSKI